jgi:replication factor C small subunit
LDKAWKEPIKPTLAAQPPELTQLDRLKIKYIPNDNKIFIEKYRPKTFNDIVGQADTITFIKKHIDNLPHLIFYGKAGLGKTTLALIIANESNSDILELNSSDERGIDTVRGRIMNFIRHSSLKGKKILFLDESDQLTGDAQLCLRPIMEKYAFNCRFILACNDISKIIEPLQSRCKAFEFKPLDPNDIMLRLRFIADNEFIKASDGDLRNIAIKSNGDMRKAINDLQMEDY